MLGGRDFTGRGAPPPPASSGGSQLAPGSPRPGTRAEQSPWRRWAPRWETGWGAPRGAQEAWGGRRAEGCTALPCPAPASPTLPPSRSGAGHSLSQVCREDAGVWNHSTNFLSSSGPWPRSSATALTLWPDRGQGWRAARGKPPSPPDGGVHSGFVSVLCAFPLGLAVFGGSTEPREHTQCTHKPYVLVCEGYVCLCVTHNLLYEPKRMLCITHI